MTALILVVLAGCAGAVPRQPSGDRHARAMAGAGAPGLPFAIARTDRVLVVAPHPDDEVLGAGGLLAAAVAIGASVRVLLVTAGDGYDDAVRTFLQVGTPRPADRLRLGAIRVDETRSALEALGLASDSLAFLGFADGQIGALWQARLAGDGSALLSPATAVSRVPYPDAVTPGAPYTPGELADQIRRQLGEFAPTIVVSPHPLDTHADHAATGEFVLAELTAQAGATPPVAGPEPRVLVYLVHHDLWPAGDAGADPMPPPPPGSVPGTRWHQLAIDEPTRGVKIEALTRHRSQMTVMGRFLLRFARGSELFGVLTPWCNGCPISRSGNTASEAPARFVAPPP